MIGVTASPATEQTIGVVLENVTAKPDVDVALTAKLAPKGFDVPGDANVIVCDADATVNVWSTAAAAE